MNEFFRVWKAAKSKYNLTRIVNKSIFKGYSMKIYSDERLIVSVSNEDEQEMYLDAATSLLGFLRIHEHIIHASCSARKESE